MPLLFSYGTLQLPEVQRASFGRLLEGTPDVLPGYRLAEILISDPGVLELSGTKVHRIACYTGDVADRIAGTYFEVTAEELEAADRYEVDAYERARVRLQSGVEASAYVRRKGLG